MNVKEGDLVNIPNLLTIIRLFFVPLFIITYFSAYENALYIAVFIFIIAGITDVLDGFIARKYNLITKFGQVLDPFADKMMQLAVLVCFTITKSIPIWIIIIYGAKELTMIFGGFLLYTKKEKVVIPANSFGKAATLTFYLAILSVAIEYEYSTYIFIIAIAFALLAFVQYSIIGSNKLKELNDQKQ